MINPKYDLNNYIKHTAIPVLTDNQKISELFRSDLLRIKWFFTPLNRLPADNKGSLRIHQKTPLGNLKPIDFPLIVDTAKDVYVQFLQISPKPDFDYEIEIISPIGMTRSLIEIWEYTLQNNPMNVFQPQDNQALAHQIQNLGSAISDAIAIGANPEITATETTIYTASPVQIASASQSTRGLIITTGTGDGCVYRVFVGDNFTAAPAFVDNGVRVELTGANAVVDLKDCRSNVWVVASKADAIVTCSRTFVPSAVPPVPSAVPPVVPPVT